MKNFRKVLVALLAIVLLSSVFVIATFAQDETLKPGDVAVARSFLQVAEEVTDVTEKSENLAMYDEYMATHSFDESSEDYIALVAEALRIKSEATSSVLTSIRSTDAYTALFGEGFEDLDLSTKKGHVGTICGILLNSYVDLENEDYQKFREDFAVIEAAVLEEYTAQKNALLQNAPPLEYSYPKSSQLFFYDFEDGKTIPAHSNKGDKIVIEPNGAPYSNGEMTSLAPSKYYLHMDGDGTYNTDTYITALKFNCVSAKYDAFVLEFDIFYKGQDSLQLNTDSINGKSAAMYMITPTGFTGRGDSTTQPTQIPNSKLTPNTWSHVSIVYNHKTQMCDLYIDYTLRGSHRFSTNPTANPTVIRMFGYCSYRSNYVDNIQGYYGTQPRQLDFAGQLTPDKFLAYYHDVLTDSSHTYAERVAAKEWFDANQSTFGSYEYVNGELEITYSEGYSEETVGEYFRGFITYDLVRAVVIEGISFIADDMNAISDRLPMHESVTEHIESKGYVKDGEYAGGADDTELADAIAVYLEFPYDRLLSELKRENLIKLEDMYAEYEDIDPATYTTAAARKSALAKMMSFITSCGEYIEGHESIIALIEAGQARVLRDNHVATIEENVTRYFKCLTPAAKQRWYDRILAALEYEGVSVFTFTDLNEITDTENGIPALLEDVEADLLKVGEQNNSSYIVARVGVIQKEINDLMMIQPSDARYKEEVCKILSEDAAIRELLYETYRAQMISHVVKEDKEVFDHYFLYFYDELLIEFCQSTDAAQQYFSRELRPVLIEELLGSNDEVRIRLAKELNVPTAKVEVDDVLELLTRDEEVNAYVNRYIVTDMANASYQARVIALVKSNADAKSFIDENMTVSPTNKSFLAKINRITTENAGEAAYMDTKINGVYIEAVINLLSENTTLKDAVDAKLELTEDSDYAALVTELLAEDAQIKAMIDGTFVTQRIDELIERVLATSAIKKRVNEHLTTLLNNEVLTTLFAGEDFDYNTVRYLRTKLGLANGEAITLDAVLALIETDAEAAEYLAFRRAVRQSEFVFEMLADNAELNGTLRASIEAIRELLYAGDYVTDYAGLDAALSIYELYNAYYYDILQNEHIAEISDALARYKEASSYIHKIGIYEYVRTYFAENDIDYENYPFFNEALALLDGYQSDIYDIPEDSELSKEEADYIKMLEENTEKFIAAVDELYAKMNYQQLTAAIMEIRTYYYRISIDSSAAQDRVAIFQTYEQKWFAWNTANEEFVKIVGELAAAKTLAERFDVLSRANAFLKSLDESYPGTADALAVYNTAVAKYEAETEVANGEISEARDVLCAQRASHSAITGVVAVLKKKYY